MLFNFELTPVKNVVPWGQPNELSLSWFGLTDGRYWIEASGACLFEYSEHVCLAGTGRYCEYQVVRLFEDILDMLPAILEAVPPALVEYISDGTGRTWRKNFAAWTEKNYGLMDEHEYWCLADPANSLLNHRVLDAAYLSPSAFIYMWSDEKYVHIEWDNSEKFIDGKLAWSATQGHVQLLRDDFLHEIHSFHARLIEQMDVRIREVFGGALSPEIKVDLPGLLSEHEQRRQALKCALEHTSSTNWQAVEKAVREISQFGTELRE